MTENQQLKNILAEKETKLAKRKAWLDEVGMGRLDDMKVAKKRIQVRKDIQELTYNIADLKEMIALNDGLGIE